MQIKATPKVGLQFSDLTHDNFKLGGGNFISYFSYYCDRTLESSNFRKGGSTLTHSLGCRSPGGRSMWLTHCTHSEEQRDKCLCPAQSSVPAHGMALVTFGGGVLPK